MPQEDREPRSLVTEWLSQRFSTEFADDDKVLLEQPAARLDGHAAPQTIVQISPPENARLSIDEFMSDDVREMIDPNHPFCRRINDDESPIAFLFSRLFDRFRGRLSEQPAGSDQQSQGGIMHRSPMLSIVVVLMVAAVLGSCSGADEPLSPPETVEVNPDAVVDYDVLMKAIDRVAEGGTVKLLEGVYDMGDKQLVITKSVRLLGAGLKRTELVGSAKGAVIRVSGAEAFSAEGIAFVKTGRSAGGGMVITTGDVQITRCRFTGSSSKKNWSYAGLWLKGDVQATVRECDVSDGDCGIDVSGDSKVSLEDNRCHSNRTAGIAVYGSAVAVLRGNECSRNEAGIFVYGKPEVQVQSSVCTKNETGVLIDGGKGCEVTDSRVTSNRGSGIFVASGSRLSIDNNTCTRNEDGIVIGDGAGVTVAFNRCERNTGTGMWIGGGTSVRARRNTCNRNGSKTSGGICVARKARPLLAGNTCEDNGSYGILYRDHAGGEARDNYCAGNQWGILINDQAQPRLRSNTCEHNSKGDVETYRGG